ncbi:MAG: hypothetical protein ACRDR6_23735, partial [Pseudonocardiaceae bacterium]
MDDGVHDQARAVAVDGGSLVGALVIPTVGLARVFQQLLDAGVDLTTGFCRQARVLLARDLQQH